MTSETKTEFNARLARERRLVGNDPFHPGKKTYHQVRGRRVGDWLRLKDGTRVELGMRVIWIEDPVHIGRIEKIENSAFASVRWEKAGWLTEGLKISELVKAEDE